MSDYDNDTDEQIAEALEKLNCELVRADKIHAADDAIMIQAYKRLRRKEKTINYEDEYKEALKANHQLRAENVRLKSLVDKLKMDLDEYGQYIER